MRRAGVAPSGGWSCLLRCVQGAGLWGSRRGRSLPDGMVLATVVALRPPNVWFFLRAESNKIT